MSLLSGLLDSDDELETPEADDQSALIAGDANPLMATAYTMAENAFDTMLDAMQFVAKGRVESIKWCETKLDKLLKRLAKIQRVLENALDDMDDFGKSITDAVSGSVSLVDSAMTGLKSCRYLRRIMGEANFWQLFDAVALSATQTPEIADAVVAGIKRSVALALLAVLRATMGMMRLETYISYVNEISYAMYQKSIPMGRMLPDSIVPNVTGCYWYTTTDSDNPYPTFQGFSPIVVPRPTPRSYLDALASGRLKEWYTDTTNYEGCTNRDDLLKAYRYWTSSYGTMSSVANTYAYGPRRMRNGENYDDNPLRVGSTFHQLDSTYNAGGFSAVPRVGSPAVVEALLSYADAYKQFTDWLDSKEARDTYEYIMGNITSTGGVQGQPKEIQDWLDATPYGIAVNTALVNLNKAVLDYKYESRTYIKIGRTVLTVTGPETNDTYTKDVIVAKGYPDIPKAVPPYTSLTNDNLFQGSTDRSGEMLTWVAGEYTYSLVYNGTIRTFLGMDGLTLALAECDPTIDSDQIVLYDPYMQYTNWGAVSVAGIEYLGIPYSAHELAYNLGVRETYGYTYKDSVVQYALGVTSNTIDLSDEVGYAVDGGIGCAFPLFGVYGNVIGWKSGLETWDWKAMTDNDFNATYSKASGSLYYKKSDPSVLVLRGKRIPGVIADAPYRLYHMPLGSETVTRGEETYKYIVFPSMSCAVYTQPRPTGTVTEDELLGGWSLASLQRVDATDGETNYMYSTFRNMYPTYPISVDRENWSFMDVLHELNLILDSAGSMFNDCGARRQRLNKITRDLGLSRAMFVGQLPNSNGMYSPYTLSVISDYGTKIKEAVDAIYAVRTQIANKLQEWL